MYATTHELLCSLTVDNAAQVAKDWEVWRELYLKHEPLTCPTLVKHLKSPTYCQCAALLPLRLPGE